MYKAKLQELCHQRKWGLPRYSAVKDGPDHMPSFKASVYVNRVTFTSGASSSLKEAHNQAAMHAFLSFSYGSSTQTSEHDTKEQIGEVKSQDIPIPAQSSVNDMDHFCKNQPQNNAQKNNHDPPVFTCKTEDMPPATDFKATVEANEQSFESPALFNTLKEVDQTAAKLDLMSLSPVNFEKGDSGFVQADSGSFKTSLLRLTERQGFTKPTYKTMPAGSPYLPTFFSTVKVEGVEFHGKGGRSKKQAEEDAAKIAYIALKACGLNVYAAFSPSQIQNKEVQSIHNSHIVKCLHNLNLEDLNDTLLANVKVSNEVHNSSFLESPFKEEMMNNVSSSSCQSASTSLPNSSPSLQLDASRMSI